MPRATYEASSFRCPPSGIQPGRKSAAQASFFGKQFLTPFFFSSLVQSHRTAHGVNQLGRIVADSVLKNDLHLFYVGDATRGVAVNHDEVGCFPRSYRPKSVRLTQKLRAVVAIDSQGLEWREPSFHKQFGFALIPEARQRAAHPSGVFTGHQKSAGLDEHPLQVHFLLESGSSYSIVRTRVVVN